MNNKLLDKVLSKIARTKDGDIANSYMYYRDFRMAVRYLKTELKFIMQPLENVHVYTLTELGKQVIDKGGYIKYKESEKVKSLLLEKQQAGIVSTKANKWLVKAKFWPHLIAVFSVCIVLVQSYNSNTDKTKLENRIKILEAKVKIK
ncbi:MAG TPA: hypothetical protein VF677_11545 [Flavobacterium sp.]|jgi:hypothetical protein